VTEERFDPARTQPLPPLTPESVLAIFSEFKGELILLVAKKNDEIFNRFEDRTDKLLDRVHEYQTEILKQWEEWRRSLEPLLATDAELRTRTHQHTTDIASLKVQMGDLKSDFNEIGKRLSELERKLASEGAA
jgi:chromosome segregation ATPase